MYVHSLPQSGFELLTNPLLSPSPSLLCHSSSQAPASSRRWFAIRDGSLNASLYNHPSLSKIMTAFSFLSIKSSRPHSISKRKYDFYRPKKNDYCSIQKTIHLRESSFLLLLSLPPLSLFYFPMKCIHSQDILNIITIFFVLCSVILKIHYFLVIDHRPLSHSQTLLHHATLKTTQESRKDTLYPSQTLKPQSLETITILFWDSCIKKWCCFFV